MLEHAVMHKTCGRGDAPTNILGLASCHDSKPLRIAGVVYPSVIPSGCQRASASRRLGVLIPLPPTTMDRYKVQKRAARPKWWDLLDVDYPEEKYAAIPPSSFIAPSFSTRVDRDSPSPSPDIGSVVAESDTIGLDKGEESPTAISISLRTPVSLKRSDSADSQSQAGQPIPTSIVNDPGATPIFTPSLGNRFFVQGDLKNLCRTIQLSGGEVVDLASAAYVILPIKVGETPTNPADIALARRRGVNPLARVLSRDWVTECFIQERVLRPAEYIVQPPSTSSKTAASIESSSTDWFQH